MSDPRLRLIALQPICEQDFLVPIDSMDCKDGSSLVFVGPGWITEAIDWAFKDYESGEEIPWSRFRFDFFREQYATWKTAKDKETRRIKEWHDKFSSFEPGSDEQLAWQLKYCDQRRAEMEL